LDLENELTVLKWDYESPQKDQVFYDLGLQVDTEDLFYDLPSVLKFDIEEDDQDTIIYEIAED